VSRDLRLPEAGEIDEQAAFQDQDVWSTSGLTKLLKAAANLLEQVHRRHDTTRHDTTRHDTTRHDTTRHDTTRHDTTHDTRHDTTRVRADVCCITRLQAKSHELCVEVLMLLTTIYKAEKKYPELISTLEQFKAMTTTLVNAVRPPPHSFSALGS
jgi:hypothetical protein